MASHSYQTLGFSIVQELGSNEIIKKDRACLVNHGGRRQEIIIPEHSFNLKIEHLEPWKPFCSLRKSNHFVEFDSTMMKPMLLNLMMHNPESSISPYAQILFSSSRAELNDMVSFASELHMSKKSARWRKLSRLVPQFQRFDREVLTDTLQPEEVGLDEVTLPPKKSSEKIKVKPSPKKQNPKMSDRANDLYKRNHLHACESLISLMLGSEQHRQTTMLSLKKSCGELSELLTRLSIGFAGTGMAVFFFVVCNVASKPLPFCANKVFDTALSFSLVLLSWAVSRLREAIVGVNRKAIKGEEATNRVGRRIKDVYFRAATVIIMVALRFR